MGLAIYEIFGSEGEWRVRHDGQAKHTYATKESAFEAAVAAGSAGLRQGHEVRITALASETATGTPNKSGSQYRKRNDITRVATPAFREYSLPRESNP